MTLEECTALLAPLAVAMRADFDEPTFRAYHAVLENVPADVGQLALEQLRGSGLRFFPTAPEIQAASERVRRQQLALHPWEPCCECETSPRWRTVIVDGVKRLERCPCVERHRAVLAERGLLEPIAQLPGESGVGENEAVYPTVEQLPVSARKRLLEVARQKVFGQ